MIEVTLERQGVRNAARRLWSWPRSKNLFDAQTKAQYGAKVDFYFIREGLRSVLFASFINPETGWNFYPDAMNIMGIEDAQGDTNRKLRANL